MQHLIEIGVGAGNLNKVIRFVDHRSATPFSVRANSSRREFWIENTNARLSKKCAAS
jgi:hypothetical protein